MEYNEEKYNRISKKLDEIMEDLSEDMLDDDVKEKLNEKVKELLSKRGVPMTVTSLKAFYEGFTFGMSAMANDHGGQVALPIIVFLKTTIAQREKKITDQAKDAMGGQK